MLLQTRVRAANTIAIYWLQLNERRYQTWYNGLDDLRLSDPQDHRTPTGYTSPTISGLRRNHYDHVYSRARHWYMFRKRDYYSPKYSIRYCYRVRVKAYNDSYYALIEYIDPDTFVVGKPVRDSHRTREGGTGLPEREPSFQTLRWSTRLDRVQPQFGRFVPIR